MLAMNRAPITYPVPAGDWRVLWNEPVRAVEKGDICSLCWQSHGEHDEYWKRRGIDTKNTTTKFINGGGNDVLPDGAWRAFRSLDGPKPIVMGP